jgi:quinohemoprotein ethanol dehydrogenase
MAYDPELDLLYIGTGNGSPWTRVHRSPGGGDNLFLSSIVALDPDDGSMRWYYQTTPGDNWDYTATQHIILADLEIDGQKRRVAMQAPKNGFFYVLDRETGELISAEKYVRVDWASRVDPATGRPVETPEGNYDVEPKRIFPGPLGGHNWHPMAYSPKTGLVYIPARELFETYALRDFEYDPGTWNHGIDWRLPGDFSEDADDIPTAGVLKAWDPVAQKQVWAIEQPTTLNGGVLATAGGLVFQGTGDGRFLAVSAQTGETLLELDLGIGVVAPPVTYTLDGVQYVSVLAGWGGAGSFGGMKEAAAFRNSNPGRLYTFELGGAMSMPAVAPRNLGSPDPPEQLASAEQIAEGQGAFNDNCSLCHGWDAASSGVLPDLRFMDRATHANFDPIVRGGALVERGMPDFSDLYEEADVKAIHGFLIDAAEKAADELNETGAPAS